MRRRGREKTVCGVGRGGKGGVDRVLRARPVTSIRPPAARYFVLSTDRVHSDVSPCRHG